MFERFTAAARAAVVVSQDVARRRDAQQLTAVHLLRAVVGADDPTARLLSRYGLDPAAVDRALDVATSGPDAALDRIDGQALAAIGIDLEQVRARLLASFGDASPSPGRPRRRLRLPGRPPARRSYAGGGHIPFSDEARRCLERSLHEARNLHEDRIGLEHLALALLAASGDGLPALLQRLGVNPTPVRLAILDEHRRAG